MATTKPRDESLDDFDSMYRVDDTSHNESNNDESIDPVHSPMELTEDRSTADNEMALAEKTKEVPCNFNLCDI